MKKSPKISKSLKRRILRTFTVLNVTSLLVLLIFLSGIMGMLFSAFSGMLSQSVASQMAEALQMNSEMKYEGLGEPYKLSGKHSELDDGTSLYLIHYSISNEKGIQYDSLNAVTLDQEAIEEISGLSIMQWINVSAKVPFNNEESKVKGFVFVELNPLLVYLAYMAVLIVFIFGFIMILIVSQIAVRLFGPNIIKPLKELEKKMNDMASGDMDAALKTQITMKKPVFEVEQLAGHANKILMTLHEYVNNLQAQQIALSDQMKQLNHVFNQIDQGVIQIDKNFKCGEAYSSEALRLFGKSPESQSLPELFYPSDEGEKAFFIDLLQQIFKFNDQSTEVYMSLLPEEILLGNKYVGLSYKLIEDHERQTSLMVFMTDLTNEKILQANIEQEQWVLKMVVKALIYSDTVRMLVKSYETFAQEAARIAVTHSYDELQREVHTFVGSFSQYEWRHTAEALRQLEDKLHEGALTEMSGVSGEQERSSSEHEVLLELFSPEHLMAMVEKDLELIQIAVGVDFLKESPQCLVEKEKILRIEDRIIELLSPEEQKAILPLVRELRYVSIKGYLEQYETYVAELGQRLDKNVVLNDIMGKDVFIDPEAHEMTFRSLVHLIRNSIDHGIESENERAEAGKSVPAQLTFSIESDETRLYIHLKDDGRGINFDALRRQALLEGYDSDFIQALDNESLPFLSRLSTKNSVSETSGRGVGMAAVREAVERTGGTISLKSQMNEGTEYIISLPLHKRTEDFTNSNDFMIGITEVVDELMCKSFGNCLMAGPIQEENRIVLDEMTAIIHLKGTLNLIVMVSVTKELIRSLLPHMIFYEMSEDIESETEEDLLSEFANTLLGNALRTFDQKEDIFHLGIPVIMSHTEGYIKYSQDTITSRQFEQSQMRMGIHLIPIHSEFIVKRFEEA